MDSLADAPKNSLEDLPYIERGLFDSVVGHLDPEDQRNVQQTCRTLAAAINKEVTGCRLHDDLDMTLGSFPSRCCLERFTVPKDMSVDSVLPAMHCMMQFASQAELARLREVRLIVLEALSQEEVSYPHQGTAMSSVSGGQLRRDADPVARGGARGPCSRAPTHERAVRPEVHGGPTSPAVWRTPRPATACSDTCRSWSPCAASPSHPSRRVVPSMPCRC